jgi:LEA14-like dessication related protein
MLASTAALLAAFLYNGCVPGEPVQFRSVKNITLDVGTSGEAMLKGDAVFYNPNNVRMKLREIRLEVWVDGKQSALIDQKPELVIPAASVFSASVEAKLSLKEMGLLNTVLNLFGGKKYDIEYRGYLRVRVHGITVKVPIEYRDDVRLKL